MGMVTTAKTWNVNDLKTWAKTHRSLVVTYLARRAFAEVERERVNAYVLPIFARYGFRNDRDFDGRLVPTGELLSSPDQLYRSKEDARHLQFYAECADAHRANGWTGDRECCPALVAEHNVVLAERQIIAAANGLCGIDASRVYGEHHKKLLDILVGMVIADGKPTKREMSLSLAQAASK